jgi:hypothetical protein
LTIVTDRATDEEKAAAWDMLMRATGVESPALTEAGRYLRNRVEAREAHAGRMASLRREYGATDPAPFGGEPSSDVSVLIPAAVNPSSELVEHFQRAVDAARALDPNLWNGPKLETYLSAVESAEDLEELGRRIAAEAEEEARRAALPEEDEPAFDAEPALEIPPEERQHLEHELADIEAALETNPEKGREVMEARAAEIRQALSLRPARRGGADRRRRPIRPARPSARAGARRAGGL